jgi:hypothetical protein
MTIQIQPAPALAAKIADTKFEAVIADAIVPGFVDRFPHSIAETIGVLAEVHGRHVESDMACIAGIGGPAA